MSWSWGKAAEKPWQKKTHTWIADYSPIDLWPSRLKSAKRSNVVNYTTPICCPPRIQPTTLRIDTFLQLWPWTNIFYIIFYNILLLYSLLVILNPDFLRVFDHDNCGSPAALSGSSEDGSLQHPIRQCDAGPGASRQHHGAGLSHAAPWPLVAGWCLRRLMFPRKSRWWVGVPSLRMAGGLVGMICGT